MNIYRDVVGYDMNYDEFKELCGKSWIEDYSYLCIDRSKKRDQGRYCKCNESKKTYIEATPQTMAFRKQLHSHSFKCYTQLKLEMI